MTALQQHRATDRSVTTAPAPTARPARGQHPPTGQRPAPPQRPTATRRPTTPQRRAPAGREQPSRPAQSADDVDVRHLRYFLTVVRVGTVSGAAEELHISQPSLSQQILRLERKVGAPLFTRSSRGVELTDSGRVFLRGVEGIPSQLRAAIDAAAPKRGTWTVGICADIPSEVLGTVEDALASRLPAREPEEPLSPVQFQCVPSQRQLELLQHGEITFGIVRAPLSHPRIVSATIWDEPLGIVVPAHHPFAIRSSLPWDELTQQHILWSARTERGPDHTHPLLAQLALLGWQPKLLPIAIDQQALFVHTLRSTPNLVALRPRSAVRGLPELTWLPWAAGDAPREQLALAALGGTPPGRILREVAAEQRWPLLDTD